MDIRINLPKGWEWKKLGEICDVRDGTHDSPKYVNEGYPLITSKNLSSGIIDFSDANLISEEDFIKVNKRSKVDKGDIIMPMIGTIGNPLIVDIEKPFAIKNVALIKFNNTCVLNKYINFLLSSSYFVEITSNNKRGGTQKFISLGDIRNFAIPLPPINIQNKIVGILERAKKLKDRRQKSNKNTNRLLQSIFFERFGKNINIQNLKDVTEIIMGQSPPSNTYNETGKGMPFFQGKTEFREKYPIIEKYCSVPSKKAKKLDVLMSVRAPVGPVNIAPEDCCIGRGLCAIRASDKILKDYLFEFLKMSEENIEAMGQGSTFKAINKKQIENIKIPVPPIKLQQEFTKIAMSVEKIKANQEKSTNEINNLFDALMQKAFNGELII